MKTRVVNVKKEHCDVYIGRGSIWGNPFVIGRDGNRKEVIEKYRTWILSNEFLLNNLNELKGKKIGCFCKPLACHGDVLVGLLENGLDFLEKLDG